MTIRPLFALILVALTANTSAQGGDPAAGEAKSATCLACHGADGNSVNPEWPKLAGQHERYLVKQLMDYKAGETRVNAIMNGLAAALSDQDMKDLGAFYASKTMSGGNADEELVALGKKIYQGGNADSGVAACMSCHGPAGKGDPLGGFPRLAGQHAQYTQTQLELWRTGTRQNDARRMMRDVVLKMTPDEIKAVSSYIAGLKPADQ